MRGALRASIAAHHPSCFFVSDSVSIVLTSYLHCHTQSELHKQALKEMPPVETLIDNDLQTLVHLTHCQMTPDLDHICVVLEAASRRHGAECSNCLQAGNARRLSTIMSEGTMYVMQAI